VQAFPRADVHFRRTPTRNTTTVLFRYAEGRFQIHLMTGRLRLHQTSPRLYHSKTAKLFQLSGYVPPPGFEPGLIVPKTIVHPLHYRGLVLRGGHTEYYLSPSLFIHIISSFHTFTMVIMCVPNQIRFKFCPNGSPGWTRTNDTCINSALPYQLGYEGM
jgi:hypothetical protein